MIKWKWNNGTENIKSPIIKQNNNNLEDYHNKEQITENIKCEIKEIQPTKEMNNREQISENLNIRQPVSQMNTNPYLSDQNYITHVENRDNFLKPVNTSKIKN